jgi:tetratricopeptide (TPR) repeat protein
MSHNFRSALFILFILGGSSVVAQVPLLQNQEAVQAIKITLDQIYNFQFEEAEERIENQEHHLGIHPANFLVRALLIYWRDRPLVPGSEMYLQYETHLSEAVELSETLIEQEELHVEGMFYSMAGNALLAELYSEEGVGLKVINAAKKAYKYLKMGKDQMGEFSDFYFSTGLYNYYRERYPELYPFYKSFMWLFMRGDMTLGIEQLKISEKEGIFTRVESTIYLYHIYLRYENNPDKAYPYAGSLVKRYPGNLRFISLLVEVLVGLNQLDQAQQLLDSLDQAQKLVYKMTATMFKGIICEKRGQLEDASRLLEKSLTMHEELKSSNFHYLSMIYATQARVADKRSDYQMARDLYKKALKSDPYVPVKEEALNYLNK